jgi:membrane protease YdiL (CAAX protease family)
VPAFLISLFGASFVQTWLYHRSQQSVLIQMILHATVNTLGSGLAFKWVSGSDTLLLWWTQSLLWMAAGVACVVAAREPRPTEAALERA